MTLCPPENAVIDQKDGSVFVYTEAHGGSRAVAVRKEKRSGRSDSGRRRVTPRRLGNAVIDRKDGRTFAKDDEKYF